MDKYSYFTTPELTNRVDLYITSVDFYTLLQMTKHLETTDIPLLQREYVAKLYISSHLLLKELTEKLSRTIFDYFCLACIGEGRHFNNHSYNITSLRNIFKGTKSKNRLAVQSRAIQYNPHIFMNRLEILFRLPGWNSGYGGEKWALICEAANMYGKVSNVTFIDHVIDITHNGGTAFDKGILIHIYDNSMFRRFLDTKKQNDEFLKNYFYSYPLRMSSQVWKILKKLTEIGLSPYPTLPKFEIERTSYIKFPIPIEWGKISIDEITLMSKPVLKRQKPRENEENEINNLDLLKNKLYIINEIKKIKEKIKETETLKTNIHNNLKQFINKTYSTIQKTYDNSLILEDDQIEFADCKSEFTNYQDIPNDSIVRCSRADLCLQKCIYKCCKHKSYYSSIPSYCAKVKTEISFEVIETPLFCCSQSLTCKTKECDYKKPKPLNNFDTYSWPFSCYNCSLPTTVYLNPYEDSNKDINKNILEVKYEDIKPPNEDTIPAPNKNKVIIKEDSRNVVL